MRRWSLPFAMSLILVAGACSSASVVVTMEIEIKVPKNFEGTATLTVAHLPLDPAQRQVIEAAQEELNADGVYRGLLPLGQYTVGEQPFDIVGSEVFTVVAR